MDIIGFIDEIIRDWRVDRDRVYLMGVCSGALRIFGLATRFPGTFAAMANIAGTFRADINQPDYSMLQNLGVMPVYQLLNIEDDVLNTTRVLDSANHMPNVTNWCFPSIHTKNPLSYSSRLNFLSGYCSIKGTKIPVKSCFI